MPSVLAIDAAWTHTEPSGIALLEETSGKWSCVALAPSYDSFIEQSNGTSVNWAIRSIKGGSPNIDDLLRAAQTFLGGKQPDLIALDMPLSSIPITGRRVADDQISSTFGGRGCSTHTPSTTRPGPLGVSLMSSLTSKGYNLATQTTANSPAKQVIEVYPHPALLTLLNEVYRVPYKVSKSSKYWPGKSLTTRITNLLSVFHRIKDALDKEISAIPLILPLPTNVTTQSSLKRYEDALDALVCGWSGVKYLQGQATPYGDHTASIWVP